MLRSTVAADETDVGSTELWGVSGPGSRCTAGVASGAGAAGAVIGAGAVGAAGNASTIGGAGSARTGIVRAGGDGSTDDVGVDVGDGVVAREVPEGVAAVAEDPTDGAAVRLMAGAAGRRWVLAHGRIGTASAASIGSGAWANVNGLSDPS